MFRCTPVESQINGSGIRRIYEGMANPAIWAAEIYSAENLLNYFFVNMIATFVCVRLITVTIKHGVLKE